MKNTYLIIVLLSQFLFSQTPDIAWQKTIGGSADDFASSSQQTSDGGYIVAGWTFSTDGDVTGNHGESDYWIVKLSGTGSVEWQRALGGANDDMAYEVQQTLDGGYILIGFTQSNDGDVTGNHGGQDGWVVKLSADGVLEWQKAIGGVSNDVADSIRQTADGGYIVAGYASSSGNGFPTNHGFYDNWITKLSDSGAVEWQKMLGGNHFDGALSVKQTTDGGYITAGSSESTNGDVTGNHGNGDAWIVKFSTLGTIEWQKCLGGSAIDKAYEVRQTPDGGYIVATYTESQNGDVVGNHGGEEVWVVKLSQWGVIEWKKALGGTSTDYAFGIQLTSEGGYIVACKSQSSNGDVTSPHGSSDAWIVKLSNTGSLQWQKTIGGTNIDGAYSVQQTTDGGYIMGGQTSSDDGDVSGHHGGVDFWIVKLEPDSLSNATHEALQFQLYPNPVSTLLTVQNLGNIVFDKILITDFSGKLMFLEQPSANQINVAPLASGIYILRAFSGNKIFINKFVKE